MPQTFSREFEAKLQIPDIGDYYSGFFATDSNISDPAAYYAAKSTLFDGGGLPAWTVPEYFFVPFELGSAVGTDFGSYRANTTGYQGSLACTPVHPNDSFDATPITLNRLTLPNGSQEVDSLNITTVDTLDHVNITITNDLGQRTRCFSSLYTFSITQGVRILGNGSLTGEFFQTMDTFNTSTLTAERFSCLNTVLIGWIRANGTISGIYDGILDSTSSASVTSYSMLACQQEIKAYPFSVTVDQFGKVLDWAQLSDAVDTNALSSRNTLQNLTSQLSPLFVAGLITLPQFGLTLHNDRYAKDWFSYIMAKHSGSPDFLDPNSSPPDPAAMGPLVSSTYATLVSIIFGQRYRTNSILQVGGGSISGERVYSEHRVSISLPFFAISVGILSFQLVVATVYCYYTRRFRIPWMPSSLAATIAYFAHSNALEDVQRTAQMSTRQRDEFLAARGGLYTLTTIDWNGEEKWTVDRAQAESEGLIAGKT